MVLNADDPRYIDWHALDRARQEILKPVPDWLEQFIQDHLNKRGGVGTARLDPLAPGECIRQGERDSRFFKMASHMRYAGFVEEEIFAAMATLNGRCEPRLPESQVRKVAHSAASYDENPFFGVTAFSGNGNGHKNGNGQVNGKPDPRLTFPLPVPASQLQRQPGGNWIWEGVVNRGGITLLTALWKAGKTTLLTHLLKKMETGGAFCGLEVTPGRVLYITEENEDLWVDRREELDLKDHLEFQVRPFKSKPSWEQWHAFLEHVKVLCKERTFDLVVMDTLSNLWPVRDENDAPQVQAALMPLHEAVTGAGCLLIHHNRKGDGHEATASRGSGALTAFVDTIIEFRRYDPSDRKCHKRVLNGYGRHRETPTETVIELTVDGYVAMGDKQTVTRGDLIKMLKTLLPTTSPGWTVKEIESEWPDGHHPRHAVLLEALHHGTDVLFWNREGEGAKGSPYRFWRTP